ncbi:MAG: M1 family metallopeptidase [Candidatus Levyibacteriota bacterium]
MTTEKKNIHLSQDINPKEYHLTIQPDLKMFVFTGEVDIVLEVKKPIKSITLHADEIDVTKATFNDALVGEITHDEDSETVTIQFAKTLPVGEGKLHLVFTGIHNDMLKGFYRSKYYIDGKEYYMVVTQFEATDARRAFPCFDEPARKAIFIVTLLVPQDHTAISNTIETEIKELGNGLKRIRYAPTPIMSTYLLAMIVGKFEYIEKKSPEGVLVRVFVTPGKKNQATFAVDAGVKILSFFTKYFGIAYPLPVLDMIAIPDFAAGAMENWGAITYRETALLIDEKNSSTANKQRVALVIGHELAHQWFGNLVTMDWWTNLWLNEGFASYIEYLAVDHLFPEWDFWAQFIFLDHVRALELDGLENTHPIEVEIEDPNDINEIYDAVSYSKGASIIRMLAEYLGYEHFEKGLQKYLKRHAYQNACTEDLWQALEDVSGKPVKKIMNNWTKKAGYPLITISETGKEFVLSQSRFYSSALSQKKATDKTQWVIPIGIVSSSQKEPTYHLMEQKTLHIPKNGDWMKFNAGEKSLVRVSYPPTLLNRLEEAIKKKTIAKEDRFGILRDLFVLAEAGKASTDQALKMSLAFTSDAAYIVWVELATEIAKVANLVSEEPYYEDFKGFAKSLFSDIVKKVGFEPVKGEDHTQKLLRSVVLGQSAKYGNEEVIKKGQTLFDQVVAGEITLDADLRGVVYTIAARNGDEAVYNALLTRYRKETLEQERDRLFLALSSFKQEELIKKALAFSLSKEVRTQDSFKVAMMTSMDQQGKYLTWEFIKNNWDDILNRYSGTYLISRFITPMDSFIHAEQAEEIRVFFKIRKAPSATRTILQVLEKIESNALWIHRDAAKIATFLKSRQKVSL